MYTKDQLKQINRTARWKGAVGKDALIPELVLHMAHKSTKILDYGAGPNAIHTSFLKACGFNVTAWDIGENFQPFVHNGSALLDTYDLVFASNVLNIQPTDESLLHTISEIQALVKEDGRVLLNYPKAPRRLALTSKDLKLILQKYFKRVEQWPKNIFLCQFPEVT